MENKNIKPVISEKSYALANSDNKYIFFVPVNYSKIQIGKEVAGIYKVEVLKVNTVVKPGKLKKDWKTNRTTRRSDMKKAIVSVKQGDKIDDFFNLQ
jgi:large subunit ribosomal protein L23